MMTKAISVSELNSYIKEMFSSDEALENIPIAGEVSNLTYHTSGHIYFTLKDRGSKLSCVMFAGSRTGLDFRLQDGMSVVVTGSIGVYERDGKYQMYARKIIREGYGELYERLEMLKKKLLQEGLFSDVNKKKIPKYCRKIGIVTAPTGAAIRDIMNIAARRNPYVQLYLYPAIVQGEEAAVSISKGIRYLDGMSLDVLIVGRGGGSFEDLFAFNEEIVCRAIYECNTPVISAVGHEVDTCLSDYAADMRAPTPSAAAELAVEELRGIYREFDEYERRMLNIIERKVDSRKKAVMLYAEKLCRLNPEMLINNKRQRLMDAEDNLNRIMEYRVKEYRSRLMLNAQKLKGLSPLERLQKGYSYVEKENGENVTKTEQVSKGDLLRIRVTDGTICARVEE